MRPLFEYVREQGHDPADVVGHVGMDMKQFDGALRWVPVGLTDRIWEHAAEVCDDANIGLHVARDFGAGSGGVVSYLATFSSTFGIALGRFVRFYSLISRTTRFSVESRGHDVRLWCRRETPCIGRQAEEVALAVVAHFSRKRCGPRFAVSGWGVRSGPPADLSEHLDLFGPHMAFGQRISWMDFSREMLQLPISTGDPQLANLLETAAEKEALESGMRPQDDLEARVRAQLARALAEGSRSGCEDVARRLGLSARTLRRQLADSGQSYRGLRDQVLEGMAEEFLRDTGLPVDEIATRLQFCDVRALSNAARRWFGMTPQQYRQHVNR